MGSRSRSIRLRIYSLVAIPLVAMVGLLAYVAGTSVNNAVNLDRAPNLINATSLPAAEFVNYLQDERAAAVTYLFRPTPASLAAYNTAIASTSEHASAFQAAMTSPATVSSETPREAAAISTVLAGLSKLKLLQGEVRARAVTPLDALAAYSQGIAAEPALFLAEANSETGAAAVGQALGLIATVQAREELSQEWALLGGMLAGNQLTRDERVAFTQAAAARQADLQSAQAILTPANLAVYQAEQNGSAAAQVSLAGIEQALAGGADVRQLGTTPAQWQATAGTLLQDYYNGGVAVAHAELAADHQSSRSAWTRVAVTSGIALLALFLTIVVTTLVARGIIRRLRGLERSALTLAHDQLPDVIARLRRGEDVDAAQEAPPLEPGPGQLRPRKMSGDEIGRVGQSFDLVRQTAIRAAVDEARLRRGLNDMFRSLARRSQSLLHRQLTLLDQMERRATDPEALDDLFRLDHLTTRMRRHAEGLIILAGAPAGRGWSHPVRMVDVMRGAIAEVEDYARVTVATRSQAALSGSAVADVIHLLAELVENATTLSPPYTSVRVAGDTVASGFAIEVEDRGLGMSPDRLGELNERLASPPEFNPADSEQLGLFVVGQLAKRHGIRVTLKASPYGGIAAIVLIPRHLVVTEDALAGPPVEPAAITMASHATNGHDGAAAEFTVASRPSVPGLAELRDLPALPRAPEIRISGPLRRTPDAAQPGLARGAQAAALGPGPSPADPGPSPADPGHGTGPGPGRPGSWPEDRTQPAFDVFTPRHRAQHAARPAPYPEPGSDPYPEPGAPGLRPPSATRPPPATPMTPVASAPPGHGAGPPWRLSGETGPLPVVPGGLGSRDGEPGTNDDTDGLPRRIRQASLAPQLRASPPPRRVTVASSGLSNGPTPAEIRQTMSALQRAWQEGRSASADDSLTAGPVPGEPLRPAAADERPGLDTGSATDGRAGGKSDGT
jgi:signal transduction histidine kinase